MRHLPLALITQDQALVAEVRAAADPVGCRLEVSASPTDSHREAPMSGRVLLGADLPDAPGEVEPAGVVALDHHERVSGRRSWLLPQDRGELTRELSLLAQRPPATPVVAVMGSSGGVGATTITAGVASALLPAAGVSGVAMLDLAGAPESPDPVPPGEFMLRRPGLTWLEPQGREAVDRSLHAACEHGAVVVADLPRWHASWLGCVDAVAVVTLNRVGPLRSARRLLDAARRHELEPRLVLVTAPGGWWPADVAGALDLAPTVVWPADRRLARAEDLQEAEPWLTRGRLRDTCAELAEALLASCASRTQR